MAAPAPTTGSPDAVPILLHALYDAASMITGMVGLTPPQVVGIAFALVCALLLWHLGRVALRKQTWTLDEAETPGQWLELGLDELDRVVAESQAKLDAERAKRAAAVEGAGP